MLPLKSVQHSRVKSYIVQPFSWKWYFETAENCKLYDFGRECWTDFKGSMTSPVRGNLPPAAQA